MKNKYKAFIIILILLTFNNSIEYYLGISIIDEVYTMVLLPILILFNWKKIRLTKNEFKIILCMIIILIIGFTGNYITAYQSKLNAVISAANTFKFVLAYFCTRLLFNKFTLDVNKEKIVKAIRNIVKVMFIIGIIANIFNKNVFISSNINRRELVLFFSHPTYVNASCVVLITLLSYYLNEFDNKRYIGLLLVMMILTFKTKAILFIILYLLFMFYFTYSKGKKRLFSLGIMFLTGIPVVSIIFNQIYNRVLYFTVVYTSTAREALMNISFKIAHDYFPIGIGFGTFGSAISGLNYSNAYYDYGIYNVYGLWPNDPKYVSDSFWPMILGENGVLGILLVIYIIYLFMKQIYKYKNSKNNWFAAFIPIIYLLTASLGESSFSNQIAVSLFFVVAIICNSSKIHKD